MDYNKQDRPFRSRPTDTTDKTPERPAPQPKRAPRPAPVAEKPAPEEKPESKYGELEFFTEEFIDNLAKVPADLMFYVSNQEKAYKAMRATNLPGDDERAAELLKRLNELRRVCKQLGYAV